jgi:putative hydrolase of the HAD superfamily
MIKAIAFDYGGVIETIDGGLTLRIANLLGTTEEEWDKVYHSLIYLFHTNKLSWEEVATLVAKKFNASDIQIDHMQEMIKENRATRRINWALIDIIKDLKDRNYKICLLSNNYIKLRQELIDLKLIDLFDTVVISAEVGCYKPQPEIFHILFKKLSVKSDEVIFIDDSQSSLDSAEEIGYTPLLFVNNEQLRKDLEAICKAV